MEQLDRVAGGCSGKKGEGYVNEAIYANIPAVRRSDLWELRKSPAHYLYVVTHEKAPTPALLFGTAAHKYILETDKFWDEYMLAPEVDKRTKDGKATWNQFLRELNETGKQLITPSDYTTIEDMDAAITAHETAAVLLKTGQHEVPVEWVDPITGELCKCRPDCLTTFCGRPYIVDYKTTTSCEAGVFERACKNYGYKLQAAMYTEGLFQKTLTRYGFAFVAQEKDPPYAVRVYFCDDGFIDDGMETFRQLIEIYHDCKILNNWPGYPDSELIGE